MIDTNAAVRLGIRNQAEHCRHLALHSRGGRVEATEDYVLFAGGHVNPASHTNGVFRLNPAMSAAELLARSDAFFGPLERAYYLWTEAGTDADLDAVAVRRGYWLRPPAEGSPCILRTSALEPATELPSGYTIEVADNDGQRREYLDILARNYDLGDASPELVEAMLFSVAALRSDAMLVLLARSEVSGEVHAAMSAYVAHGCVGHEWAATDPKARGRGLGSVMTRQASNWGFAQGAACGFAVASQQAISTWRTLGFDVPTRVRRYLVTPESPMTSTSP